MAIETGRIGKTGMGKPKLSGFGVHHGRKPLNAPAKVYCNGKSSIIARLDHCGFNQIKKSYFFARQKTGLGRFDLCRFKRNRHKLIEPGALNSNNARKYLRETCRFMTFPGIFFKQHL